ncbi:N-acetyltransferase [Rhodococcoides trifolii]|uniref:N-acetyltransferase n=1 Tax=Rhodococcoides trifolii TaxID=908250 RepID=A0A917CRJ3_9NOCA|nr:GNAT family N-acetyltransferase [Rhodococcus trifolii]GGF96170.1 N-acetyltransferase [Rhodococcus trifolii]
MIVRPMLSADLEAVVAFPPDPTIRDLSIDRVRAEFAAGRFRPEWTWIAESNGALVGRALWWGRSDSTSPLALDSLHVLKPADRVAVGAALLTSPTFERPEYVIALEPGSNSQWRIDAAARAGLTERLERLQVEWTPASGAPPASTRLTFRSGTDEEFVDLFVRAAVGTRDVTTARALTVMTPDEQARDDLDFYLGCPGERSWWCVAEEDDEVVGFILPSATPYSRNVGYLGVLPEHRGRGLVDDLLAEVTRINAGAERITATTDVTNEPMAAAFERAGYRVTEVRLVLTADPATAAP